MDIALDNADIRYRIQAYVPGKITISGQVYEHSLIVSADTFIAAWPVLSIDKMQIEDCYPILKLMPKMVIFGTGEQSQPLPECIVTYFNVRRIGVESMTNEAACRTYAVLTAEQRKVVAAFYL